MQMKGMQALTRSTRPLLSALVMMALFACNAIGTSSAKYAATSEQTPGELRASDSALVDRTAVAAPLGKFLLVRRGSDICAVRFTKFHGGVEAGSTEYDWYFQGDGSADFRKANVSNRARASPVEPRVF